MVSDGTGNSGDAQEASPPQAATRDGRSGNPAERARIVAATLDVVAVAGFAKARADDIIATAGVGRRTYWSYFTDKSEALIAGYVGITRDLRSMVQAAHDGEPDPVQRVVACLTTVAEFLAADPARAEVLLIQGPCAGHTVAEVRMETIRRLAELLTETILELAPVAAGAPDRSAIVIESLAGGLYEVAYTRVFRGQVQELPALIPELARIVLAPYLDTVDLAVLP